MKNIKKISFIVLLLSIVKVDGLLGSFDSGLACYSEGVSQLLRLGKSQKNALLERAVDYNSPTMVKMLLSIGADPNAQNKYGEAIFTSMFRDSESPWLRIMRKKENLYKIVNHFIDAGVDIRDGLMLSVAKGECEYVKLFFEKKPKLKLQGEYGNLLLRFLLVNSDPFSTSLDRLEILKLILAAGAEPNVADNTDRTPLDYCKRDDMRLLILKKIRS